jgi:hypothetical protein
MREKRRFSALIFNFFNDAGALPLSSSKEINVNFSEIILSYNNI